MPTNLYLHNIAVEKDKVVADMRYPYLESRDYIQGVVVLDGMLQCAKALHPKATNDNTMIVEAKIMKPINYFTQCIALPTSSTENTFKSKDLLAKVELNIDGHSTTVVTLPKEDKPVT
ncbi:MAG: hypothetical protein PQJ28_04185, partial [Spirochaetales bacterium]|nr:hypothetical protein [Spirochaetales bacterium]